jgi:antitoxin component YwqK of YwqJK toxin-antitoxin module
MTHSGYFMQNNFMLEVMVTKNDPFIWKFSEFPERGMYQARSFVVKSITNISDNSAKTGIVKYKVGRSYIERPMKAYYKSKEVAFNNMLDDNTEKGYFPNGISGINTTYHPNGQLKEKYFHTNGIKEGEYIYYHENGGGVGAIRNYVNGKSHGKCVYYHADGSVYIDATYINGKLHGSYKKILRDGTLFEDSIYMNGIKME